MHEKKRYRQKLIEYLGDPDNEFLSRTQMHRQLLGVTAKTFYKHFKPPEILDIENESMELRKKNSARRRSAVYTTLYNKAIEGNIHAIKEFLNRIEGRVPNRLDHASTDGTMSPKQGIIPKKLEKELKELSDDELKILITAVDKVNAINEE